MSLSRMVTVILLIPIFGITRQAAAYIDPHAASSRNAAYMASPYVPLESWIYPAFEMLAAKGHVQSAFPDLRPWTRLDCARLLEESEDLTVAASLDNDVLLTMRILRQEFSSELTRRAGDRNLELRLESLDQRVTTITGRPLTDGYHFAETLVDDDGRPFAPGANIYSGISIRGDSGSLAFYLRSEIQRVPSAPTPNAQAEQQIAAADFTPLAAAGPLSNVLRGRVLEASVSLAFANNQLTFGQQTVWWGPARSGSTLFSNNAEPITMLRYDRLRPIVLPGFLSVLGPIRAQLLIGRLAGAQYIHTDHATFGVPAAAIGNQPFLHGEKVSFMPTPNLQFGVSHTVIFGGQGAPVTTSSVLRSIFSGSVANEQDDPGDRRTAFDAEYRIPALRTCLAGYVDTFTEDQPFPLNYPQDSTWITGFVLRCVPRVSRLTLRAEGLLSPRRALFPGFYYFNVHYLSGYTNNRQIIGSWIGREGQGEQLWATWQLSPRSSFEVSGRSMNASGEFLRGGSLRDLRVAADIALRPEWHMHLEDQAEWWHFPLLSAQPQRNNAFTLQLSYRPIGSTQ